MPLVLVGRFSKIKDRERRFPLANHFRNIGEKEMKYTAEINDYLNPLGANEIEPMLKAGKLEEAKTACEEVLALTDFSIFYARHSLANIYKALGDFKKEEETLRQLLKEVAEGLDSYSLSEYTNRLVEIQDLDCLAYSLFEGEDEDYL